MATYAISDIHGAREEFLRLLRKINFHYDGSDSLYLLGDYIDWGEESLETLLLVKELDEQYDFVHCTLGNHELMFLQTLESGYDGFHGSEAVDLWLYSNHGIRTWNAFCDLPPAEAADLIRWLRGLKLSYTVMAGGHTFMLAHAYPYYYDAAYTPEEEKRRRQDAVWHRVLLRENPFADYRGNIPYDCLICGHTISDRYHTEAHTMDHNPGMSMQAVGNRIFFGKWFIDIDCGAKCMSLDPTRGQAGFVAVMRAQLAALRLEDMAEFYVRHSPMPDVSGLATAAQDKVGQYLRGLQFFG